MSDLSHMSHEHEPFDGGSGDEEGSHEPFDFGGPFDLPPGLGAELAGDEAEIKSGMERFAESMDVGLQAEAAAEAGTAQMRRLLEAGATDGNTELIWSMLGTLAARQLALASSITALREMHVNTSRYIVRQAAMMEMVRRTMERLIDEGDAGEGWKRGERPSPEDGE
jgi:hypothetical protein